MREKIHAKKSLGQHFLRNRKILDEMLRAGTVDRGDVVLEIGPGEGVLTRKLLAAGAQVTAVEKDHRLIPLLQSTFVAEIARGALKLIHDDILNPEITTENLQPAKFKIVANIPYYITGAILEKFLSAQRQPERIVFLIQKEVAERIVGRDCKESILSISVKAYGTPKIVRSVARGNFTPVPKVDSAILLIENISRKRFTGIDEKYFFETVRTSFRSKRKTIGNNLKTILPDSAEQLMRLGIDPKRRAETLSIKEWQTLARAIRVKSE